MQPIPVLEGAVDSASSSRVFIAKVYMWMAIGLFITSVISVAPFLVLGESEYMMLLVENIFIFYGLLIFELLLVFGLTAMINKIPAIVGILVFMFYSFLNGITLSPIFILYTGASIFLLLLFALLCSEELAFLVLLPKSTSPVSEGFSLWRCLD